MHWAAHTPRRRSTWASKGGVPVLASKEHVHTVESSSFTTYLLTCACNGQHAVSIACRQWWRRGNHAGRTRLHGSRGTQLPSKYSLRAQHGMRNAPHTHTQAQTHTHTHAHTHTHTHTHACLRDRQRRVEDHVPRPAPGSLRLHRWRGGLAKQKIIPSPNHGPKHRGLPFGEL